MNWNNDCKAFNTVSSTKWASDQIWVWYFDHTLAGTLNTGGVDYLRFLAFICNMTNNWSYSSRTLSFTWPGIYLCFFGRSQLVHGCIQHFYLFIFLFFLFYWFYLFLFIFFYITLQYCIGFAIYQNESATGIHVFPSLNPPPSSLLIPSLWVIPVHQPQASSIVHQTWTGDSCHIWYYTVSYTGLLLPSF